MRWNKIIVAWETQYENLDGFREVKYHETEFEPEETDEAVAYARMLRNNDNVIFIRITF